MKRSTFALVCLLAAGLAAASLSGCSPPATTNPEPPAPLELTAKDTGSTQQMQTGQEAIISLEANPTTGYEWAVDGDVPAQLEQVGEPKYSSESSAVGAGGTEVWSFMAKSSGQGTLKLKYWRSFEPTAAPVETFELKVDVK